MKTEIINTTNAPAPIGPYSQAVKLGELLFVSGQICINPATGQLSNASIEDETKQVMENIVAILAEINLGCSHIVKSTIFITDMNMFATVNAVYGTYFKDSFPARETIQAAALPKGVNVEISVIAAG